MGLGCCCTLMACLPTIRGCMVQGVQLHMCKQYVKTPGVLFLDRNVGLRRTAALTFHPEPALDVEMVRFMPEHLIHSLSQDLRTRDCCTPLWHHTNCAQPQRSLAGYVHATTGAWTALVFVKELACADMCAQSWHTRPTTCDSLHPLRAPGCLLH